MVKRESSKVIYKRIQIEIKLYALTCMMEESEKIDKALAKRSK